MRPSMRRLTKCLFIVTSIASFIYGTLLCTRHDVTSILASYRGGNLSFTGTDQREILRQSLAADKPPVTDIVKVVQHSAEHGENKTNSDRTKVRKEKTASATTKAVPKTKPKTTTKTVGTEAKTAGTVAKTAGTVAKTEKAITQTTNATQATSQVVTKKTMTDQSASKMTSSNQTLSGKKYLIFVCDGKRSCGGWSDRQRALVSVYILANVTNRTFGLQMTRPCDVSNFYVPNEVNWVVSEKELAGKSNVSIDDMQSRLRMTARLIEMDFNKEFPVDVVYIRTNGEYYRGLLQNKLYAPQIPAWTRSQATYFRNIWNILMKPSPKLQKSVDEFLARANYTQRKYPFVCAHVRVGHSATFRDSEYRTRPSELPALWSFLTPYANNGSLIFLATDSVELRNISEARFGNRIINTGGKIVHVDHQGTSPDGCEGLGSALLDQQILSKCDVLVKTNSGFGYRAALMRGTSENLYSLKKGKVVKTR